MTILDFLLGDGNDIFHRRWSDEEEITTQAPIVVINEETEFDLGLIYNTTDVP